MSQSSIRVLNVHWQRSRDFALVARLCDEWNSGRLYEIFWEYARLSAAVLKERGANSWFCFENEKLSGFSLGRIVRGVFVMEEMWAPFDGTFGDNAAISENDRVRAEAFGSEVLAKTGKRPLLIRGAVDNHFAHGVARFLKLPWFNGLILAERAVPKKTVINVPSGFSLRPFASGDEAFFSSLYREVYRQRIPKKVFRDWATKRSCRTTVATKGSAPAGFIISEKRPYNSLGDFAIAVLPRFQRMGVGGALLDAGLDALHDLGAARAVADYRTSNGATHALYGGRGFKPARVYNFFRAR